MLTLQKIKTLIENNQTADALRMLDELAVSERCDDLVLMERGKLRWRLGMHSGAVEDYERALALNPENRQASAALEISRDIFDFFNPDLLNP